MKISKRTIDDLLIMTSHSRQDISYGDGGTFNQFIKNGKEDFDPVDARRVLRAIEFIKKLILERDN
jgi:hypothetical protein